MAPRGRRGRGVSCVRRRLGGVVHMGGRGTVVHRGPRRRGARVGGPRHREAMRLPDLPSCFTTADARKAGLTEARLTRAVARGPSGAGPARALPLPGEVAPADRGAHHVALLGALLADRDDAVAASHLSAAAVWQLPLPLGGLHDTHLLRPPRSRPVPAQHGPCPGPPRRLGRAPARVRGGRARHEPGPDGRRLPRVLPAADRGARGRRRAAPGADDAAGGRRRPAGDVPLGRTPQGSPTSPSRWSTAVASRGSSPTPLCSSTSGAWTQPSPSSSSSTRRARSSGGSTAGGRRRDRPRARRQGQVRDGRAGRRRRPAARWDEEKTRYDRLGNLGLERVRFGLDDLLKRAGGVRLEVGVATSYGLGARFHRALPGAPRAQAAPLTVLRTHGTPRLGAGSAVRTWGFLCLEVSGRARRPRRPRPRPGRSGDARRGARRERARASLMTSRSRRRKKNETTIEPSAARISSSGCWSVGERSRPARGRRGSRRRSAAAAACSARRCRRRAASAGARSTRARRRAAGWGRRSRRPRHFRPE